VTNASISSYSASLAAQAQALQQASTANDNAASSFHSSGLEIASTANRLRQASEAAYAFSLAFRSVVNGLAVPAISAAGTAIAAVAAGIVTGTNFAGSGLIKLASAAEIASPALLGVTGYVRSAGIAMEGFNPAVTGVASSILSRVLPAIGLLGPAMLVLNGI
jgi:hypothetical protein